MKPFDLDKALKGAKVVTEDNTHVIIAGYNEKFNSLLGWKNDNPMAWTGCGKSASGSNDLFMAPTTRKEWIVRCPEYKVVGPFHDKGLADHWIESQNRPDATLHEITITE